MSKHKPHKSEEHVENILPPETTVESLQDDSPTLDLDSEISDMLKQDAANAANKLASIKTTQLDTATQVAYDAINAGRDTLKSIKMAADWANQNWPGISTVDEIEMEISRRLK